MQIKGIEFYPIPGHEMYLISRAGDVYGLQRNKMLIGGFNRMGYPQVWFGTKWYRRHYLVALSFIPNPEGYKEVNHMDGDKLNNNVNNLEWCSRSYNQAHGFANRLMNSDHISRARKGRKASEHTKKLMSINKIGKNHPKYTGDYVTPKGRFHSANAAAEAMGTNGKTIQRRCNNKTWLHLGYDFIPKK